MTIKLEGFLQKRKMLILLNCFLINTNIITEKEDIFEYKYLQ